MVKKHFGGERLVPGTDCYKEDSVVFLQHKRRYEFASGMVEGCDCLDIACGVGYGSHILLSGSPKSVLGMDISQEAIEYAKGHYTDVRLSFRCSDATSIPIPNESVDIVISFETLEHIEAFEDFIREVHRVLRPSGVLVVSTPNGERIIRHPGRPPANPFHFKEFTLSEFLHVLASYGFRTDNIYGQTIIPGNQRFIRIARSMLRFPPIGFGFRVYSKICQMLSTDSNELPLWSGPPKHLEEVAIVACRGGDKVFQNLIAVCRRV